MGYPVGCWVGQIFHRLEVYSTFNGPPRTLTLLVSEPASGPDNYEWQSKCPLSKLSTEERNTNVSEKGLKRYAHDPDATHPNPVQYPFYNENTNRVNDENTRRQGKNAASTPPCLHKRPAQRDGGPDGDTVEENEDPGDVDEPGLAGGRCAGALLHEPRLRGAHGQQEDGESRHDVHGRRRGACVRVRCAGEPEGGEAEQPLQREEGDGGDAEPRVEARQVRRHGQVVELERRVHAEDGQDQAHQVDQHVRHLLRPVVHRDRRVRQDRCN
jgi:hypothetical protein